MSFVAGAISGGLDWETQSFEKGFLRVEALMQTFPSIVTQFMASPMLGLVGIAQSAMIGVATAINQGVRFIFRTLDESAAEADKIGDLATNIGVSAEELSGLGLVAKQAGSSVEAVADALKFLGRNSAEARQGNKDLAGEFGRLDIQLADSAGKARPLNDLMLDLADAIAGIQEPGERTRLAMALLGRSGTDMIATLSQGSSAIRDQIATFSDYGAVVTDQAAKSGDRFQDLRGEIATAWQGIKNQLAEPLRETLTPVLENMLGWLRTHQPQVRDFMENLAKTITDVVQRIIQQIVNLKAELAGIAVGSVAGAVAGGIIGGVVGGPAGAFAGAGIGYKLGGGAVAAGSYLMKPTVVVQPYMSDSQTGRVIREVYEQNEAARQAALDRQAREQRINSGW